MTSGSSSPVGGHPHFDAAEFAGRIARLRARMRDCGVGVALFDEIEAMAWLSGYGNSENRWRCVGVPLEGDPFIVIRALDAEPCRQKTWVADVRTFRDWEDPMAVLAAALGNRGLREAAIGIDFGSYCMPLSRFGRLREALPHALFVDVGNVVWELRLIKSAAEIRLLRRAAAVADESLLLAAAACRHGNSQRDAAKAAVAAFVELGADPGPPGPISTGRGWDFLHGHLVDAPLVDGDVVHIELTPRIQGYSARLMRCVAVGTPSKEMERSAELLRDIQDRQIAAMVPGAIAHDVDAILRDAVLSSGLRESFDNITGYTLGFYSHAGPRTSDFTRIFHPGAQWKLEPNMVFHMYASARGASFSETVVITEQGPERLTSLPRELMVSGTPTDETSHALA
jgi:Xaa-Pro aminopeptidase